MFSRDSSETKFFEGLPIVGYIASAVHAIAGNNDHAKRAAAKSTNSSITLGAAIGGGLLGGPAGAMAGSAAGNAIGIGVERAIAESINDKSVRSGVGSVAPSRFLVDMSFSAISSGMGSAGASTVAKQGLKSFVAGQASSTIFAGVPKSLISQEDYY